MMEFTFEQSPWELTLDAMHPGDSLSALRCLALLEDMSLEDGENALLDLEERKITLDISDLPLNTGSGETALRLQQEQKLVKAGQLLTGLEENDPLRLFLEELAEMPVAGDKAVLIEKYVAGDDEVAGELVKHCLSLVVERACANTGRGVLLLDLIQDGNLGLWQGILNYIDGDFDSHIQWWIDQYIHKAILMQAHCGDVGQKMRQGMADYRDADQQLLADLGRNPTLEEIAEAIHVSVEEAATYAAALEQARLRQQVDTLTEPKEETPDDEQAVENTAYFQTRQRIEEMLSGLSEQEAKLLTLRFGLDGTQPMDPVQAGRVLGMTPDEIIKMETAALEKLRH